MSVLGDAVMAMKAEATRAVRTATSFKHALSVVKTMTQARGLSLSVDGDPGVDEHIGDSFDWQPPAWFHGPRRRATDSSVPAFVANDSAGAALALRGVARGLNWELTAVGCAPDSFYMSELGLVALAGFIDGVLAPDPVLIGAGDISNALAVGMFDSIRQRLHGLPQAMHRERLRLLRIQLIHVDIEFQPILELGPSPRYSSYEALARDRSGSTAPTGLFDAAEDWDLTLEVDLALAEASIRGYAKALDAPASHGRRDGQELPLAVNVYGQTLIEPDFWRVVGQLVTGDYPRLHNRLTFEFSEKQPLPTDAREFRSAVMNMQGNLSVQIAIDDFGAGYSSMGLLSQLRPDYVKVDKSIMHAPKDEAALCLRYVSEMLKLRTWAPVVVVEGFDDDCPWTPSELFEMEIKHLQGFRVGAAQRTLDRLPRHLAERLSVIG
jgi:EAL domain-containing protein (putative c-di-GMP-specific phosphodiesterase class I)